MEVALGLDLLRERQRGAVEVERFEAGWNHTLEQVSVHSNTIAHIAVVYRPRLCFPEEIQVAAVLVLGSGIHRGAPRVEVELAGITAKVEAEDKGATEGAGMLPPREPEGEGVGRVVWVTKLIGGEIGAPLVEVELAAFAGVELADEGLVAAVAFWWLLLFQFSGYGFRSHLSALSVREAAEGQGMLVAPMFDFHLFLETLFLVGQMGHREANSQKKRICWLCRKSGQRTDELTKHAVHYQGQACRVCRLNSKTTLEF